jgi:hypothetical protein
MMGRTHEITHTAGYEERAEQLQLLATTKNE